VAERFADGLASQLELAGAQQGAIEARTEAIYASSGFSSMERPRKVRAAIHAAHDTTEPTAYKAACRSSFGGLCAIGGGYWAIDIPNPAWDAPAARQADLIRCLWQNPFRPIAIAPSWLTPTVLDLAQAAYDQRDLPQGTLELARLAVLTDALEDAGCTDPDILGHLRQPGPHTRGCWPLDLLLERD